jgi:hypothetical protein
MQALIGFYQFFNGLPILVVALHLIGSALFVAVVSMAVEKHRGRWIPQRRIPAAPPEPVRASMRPQTVTGPSRHPGLSEGDLARNAE